VKLPTWEEFKEEFLRRSKALLEAWSAKYGVDVPPVYVIGDEVLDPFIPTAVYVRPSILFSDIRGPAIVFAEGYLRAVYEGALDTGDFETAWNCLLWSLAHEFGHHIAWRKHPVRWGLLIETAPFREYIVRAEISASLIAHHLTKKTRAKKNLDFTLLTGMSKRKFWEKRHLEWLMAKVKKFR